MFCRGTDLLLPRRTDSSTRTGTKVSIDTLVQYIRGQIASLCVNYTTALMQSILELSGFSVTLAVDGADGIERACAETPDLIITDIAMPRLNGLEMIQKLRTMPELKATPILAVTSHGMEKAMDALKARANRSLARPVQNHLLLVLVFDLLEKVRPGSMIN
jgi:CheY-like chemotaxis protein